MVEAEAVIVTGGAGGIGKATVRRLLDTGRSVFVIDLDAKRWTRCCSTSRPDGRLDGLCADVKDEQAMNGAVERAAERFGDIYGLVHVAGGAGPKRARDIEDLRSADWTHVMDLNLTSAFLAARAAVPFMRRRRRGRIVLFSSIIADGEKGPLTTVTGRLPYATAKAALLGFTSAARQGPRRSRHHRECADAGPDPGRARHAHPRPFRRTRARGARGAARRLSRRASPAAATTSRPRSAYLLSAEARLRLGRRPAGRRRVSLRIFSSPGQAVLALQEALFQGRAAFSPMR